MQQLRKTFLTSEFTEDGFLTDKDLFKILSFNSTKPFYAEREKCYRKHDSRFQKKSAQIACQ